ncbi:MAG: lauroyl acyltransferase [Alphaproteobacteria bacterium]|nr:lauroyl acyltransferase [Alphaproteobacteria bacterium]
MKAPTPYRRLRRAAEAALMRGLMALLRRLSVERASAMGGAIGRAIGPHLRVTRHAVRNLRACFPEKTGAEIDGIVTSMWDNLGRTAFEYAHLGQFRFNEPGSHAEIRGMQYVDQVITAGQGAIFVSGHFANWELLALALVRHHVPVMAVYRAASNPLADEIITALRNEAGTPHLAPKGPAGARMLLNWIKERKFVAMLADQKMNDGVEAPFFSRPAMCPPAAAQLALRYGCPIVFATIRRTHGAHFVIEVQEPFYISRGADRAQDIREGVIEINRRLETFIRAHPAQWLWLHRRWPEGD